MRYLVDNCDWTMLETRLNERARDGWALVNSHFFGVQVDGHGSTYIEQRAILIWSRLDITRQPLKPLTLF